MSQQAEIDLPVANLRPIRRRSLAWLIPLLAIILVIWFGDRAWQERGPRLVLHAQDGHGIKPGALLRYRGIAVGEVTAVDLRADLQGVEFALQLQPGAEALARAGSRFWVVRPDISLDRLRGLDTILGARHLSVLPGSASAAAQHEFICLEEAPLALAEDDDGIEFILEAPRRMGLAPGAPISYRDLEIGSILSVSLSSDATRVEVRARVRQAYVQLVREDSRFWETSGIEFSAGLLGGVKLNLKSLRSLIVGGIALATPTQPGPLIRTGHRFQLASDAKEAWLEWTPALPLGGELLPAGTPRVDLQRARLAWEEGMFGLNNHASAWIMPMPGFVIGPASVLAAVEDADHPELEVRGRSLELSAQPDAHVGALARRAISWNDLPVWPLSRIRDPLEPEDVVAVVDSNRAPMAVDALRLTSLEPSESGESGALGAACWSVDAAIPFGPDWNGAAVIARSDGFLLGILLVDGDGTRVQPVSQLVAGD